MMVKRYGDRDENEMGSGTLTINLSFRLEVIYQKYVQSWHKNLAEEHHQLA